MTKNSFGLSQDIPEAVKRAVRQHCGFRCVICGVSIVEYEHVMPEFAKAKRHDPECITLLCPNCHARVTRNYLSKRRIREAMAKPKCRETGFSFSPFDIGSVPLLIKIAGLTLKNCPTPIRVREWSLIRVEQPEVEGGPYQVSASFFDGSGNPSLFLEKNEWRIFSGQWDVEVVGGRIEFHSEPRVVALALAFDPSNGIIVEKIDMYVMGYRFEGNADTLVARTPDGGVLSFTGCIADHCQIGMQLG